MKRLISGGVMVVMHERGFYTKADLEVLRKENDQLRKALVAKEELRMVSNQFSYISRNWRRKKAV